jgi:hypothetical protein
VRLNEHRGVLASSGVPRRADQCYAPAPHAALRRKTKLTMGQLVAWISLVVVASTSAYALQLTAASMLPAAAPADQFAPTVTGNILIVAVDPVTGDRAQLECHAPSGAFPSNVVVVEAMYFSEIARVCT